MDALCGSRYSSCLDLRSKYWQISVKEEYTERTPSTLYPLGFYEFNSVHFDLTNSPATVQKLKHSSLGDLHTDCSVFLDDIIIFSSTVESRMQILKKVLYV